MTEIPLTKGKVATVDDEDADLARLKWGFYTIGYAMRNRNVRMHRIVLERKLGRSLRSDEYPDHINRNRLDNRRANLRLATKSQNGSNSELAKDNTSGFKGVYWDGRPKLRKRWRVEIRKDWRKVHIGYFAAAEEGACAYDAKAIELFGEFAATNAALGVL